MSNLFFSHTWHLLGAEFDEGHLKADTVQAAEEIINTLAILDDKHPPVSCEKHPILHMYQSVWQRFQEVRTLASSTDEPTSISQSTLLTGHHVSHRDPLPVSSDALQQCRFSRALCVLTRPARHTALQKRFKELHKKYMIGCLQQVHLSSKGDAFPALELSQYMEYRRWTVGTYPAFPVIEHV